MMNLSQTKLVGLTMELDLKTREYKKLCDKLDKLKENKIDPNDERLLAVKELFQKNYDEIVEINRQIKELKETEKLIEKQKLEQYDPDYIFKNKSKKVESEFVKSHEEKSVTTIPKEIWYQKVLNLIKNLFCRNK